MTPEEFRRALQDHGIEPTDQQMTQFAIYYEDLVATNEHVNLTAITDQKEVYLKHFYDSLTGALAEPRLQTEALTLCDIGAGAGFPSLPLKIAFPQAQDYDRGFTEQADQVFGRSGCQAGPNRRQSDS